MPQPNPRHAALGARPQTPTKAADPGIHPLQLGNEIRDGRLYIPRATPGQPLPLLVLLHGAGSDCHSMLHLVGANALAKG